MEIDEISTGLVNMMIPREFINSFWAKLKELNPKFFELYTYRVEANQQIAKFNSLATSSLASKKRKVEVPTKLQTKPRFDTSFLMKRLQESHHQKIEQEQSQSIAIDEQQPKSSPTLSRKSSENSLFNADEYCLFDFSTHFSNLTFSFLGFYSHLNSLEEIEGVETACLIRVFM